MRLPRRKMRHRGRYVMIPILVMMVVPILLVWSNTSNRPNVSNANRDASLPSPFCRKGDPLTGIYNPLRFRVLSNCEKGSGIVSSITPQADGSIWINVTVDGQYSKLLGPGNISYQNGLLVLEDSSRDQAATLSKGEPITFVGPLVYDTDGKFDAIVPVWSIKPS